MKMIEVSDEAALVIAKLQEMLGENWWKAIWPPPERSGIRKSQEVMGGDACIRDTRIPVWLMVSFKRQGLMDRELLLNFPQLQASDLAIAWEYYAANATEIDEAIARHQAEDGEVAG